MVIIVLFKGFEIWGINGMILIIPLIGILRDGFSQFQVLKPYVNIIDHKESEQKSGQKP